MRMTLQLAHKIIQLAQLDGFGGNCGRVAIAINHVLFNGKGKYIVATNPPLNEKMGEMFFGHVVVEWRGRLFDATGGIDDEVGVESWGMLDPSDPEVAAVLTEDEAHQGELHYLEGTQAEQEAAIEAGTSRRGRCSIRNAEYALREAMTMTKV